MQANTVVRFNFWYATFLNSKLKLVRLCEFPLFITVVCSVSVALSAPPILLLALCTSAELVQDFEVANEKCFCVIFNQR